MRTELILIGLLFLALSTAAAAEGNGTLRVIGAGTVEVPADTVIILVSAQSMDHNSTIAAENNSVLLNRTKDALIASGVQENEIMPGRPKGYAEYHTVVCNTVNNTTKCEDVVASQVTERMILRLKTSDENETERVIENARSSGARATILGYALSDPDRAVADARKSALEDARSQAEDYAAAFGLKLGKSVGIDEIGYPDIEVGPSYDWDMPMRMHSRLGMDPFSMSPFSMMGGFFGGDYIPAGMAEVTAYVSVTYEVS